MQQNWAKLWAITGFAISLPLHLHAQTLHDPNEAKSAAVTVQPAASPNTVQSLRDPSPVEPPAKIIKKTTTTHKTRTVTVVTETQKSAMVSPVPPTAKPVNRSTKLIVIDAGHGGPDSGAVGVSGHYEKNLTLAMAKLLRGQLEAKGYKVALTRETDIFIPLFQRVKIARNKNADLFVSLHANSMPEENSARGFSIYTLSDKASDETAARLAAKENKADLIGGVNLGNVPPDVSNILLDLTWRETNAHSVVLASDVVQSIKTSQIKTLDGPMRSAGFAVLKAPDMPSVLMEMGFLSNATEEAQMFDPDYQTQLARSLATGIDNFVKDALD